MSHGIRHGKDIPGGFHGVAPVGVPGAVGDNFAADPDALSQCPEPNRNAIGPIDMLDAHAKNFLWAHPSVLCDHQEVADLLS